MLRKIYWPYFCTSKKEKKSQSVPCTFDIYKYANGVRPASQFIAFNPDDMIALWWWPGSYRYLYCIKEQKDVRYNLHNEILIYLLTFLMDNVASLTQMAILELM